MKKVISILLLLSMLVCMIPAVSLTSYAEENPTIEPDTSWYIGHESETEYKLYDAADLLGFAKLIATAGGTYNDAFASKTVFIENDIDINPGWKVGDGTPDNVWPEMVNTRDFSGTIDGKGHTISGIYQINGVIGNGLRAGIFANVSGGTAKIKDIVIINSYSETNTSDSQGFIWGSSSSDATVNLENVYVDAVLVNTDASGDVSGMGIGGLIGGVPYANGSTGSVTMKNCVFAGSITVNITSGTTYVGGLLGRYNTKGAQFTDCASYATIKGSVTGTAETPSNLLVGGILGDSIGKTRCVFTRCVAAPTFEITKNITGENSGALVFGEFVGASRYQNTAYSPFTFDDVIYSGSNAILGSVYAQGTTTFETSGTAYTASIRDTKVTKVNDFSTSISEWTAWSANGNKPMPTEVLNMLTTPVAEIVGYQATDEEDGKFNFRIVGVLNVEENDLANTVLSISATATYTLGGEKTLTLENYPINTVYETINGNSDTGLVTYDAKELGGNYIFVLPCKNVPANATDIKVEITVTYTVNDGNGNATRTLYVEAPKDAVN